MNRSNNRMQTRWTFLLPLVLGVTFILVHSCIGLGDQVFESSPVIPLGQADCCFDVNHKAMATRTLDERVFTENPFADAIDVRLGAPPYRRPARSQIRLRPSGQ